MKIRRWKVQHQQEHDEIQKVLEQEEQRLDDMARRLRRLETEAGIYKPPLRRAKG